MYVSHNMQTLFSLLTPSLLFTLMFQKIVKDIQIPQPSIHLSSYLALRSIICGLIQVANSHKSINNKDSNKHSP